MKLTDTLLAALTPSNGHFRDSEPDTIRTLQKLFDDLEGPRLLFPHYKIPLWKLLKDVDELPPLQSCNKFRRTNCGTCRKCKEIRAAMKKAGKPELWSQMNAR